MMPQDQSLTNLYIGLMSGTSADGIDLALVNFTDHSHQLIASFYQPYTDETRALITALYTPSNNEIDRMGYLDKLLSQQFATAIKQFLLQQCLQASDIKAIGNHGQTIRHRPEQRHAFTLQISCNQTLACLTGIKVIGKFRDKDIALGGQGAPLVPAYHKQIFASKTTDVCVVNIGGISNITFLPAANNASICGFDTGPGNALLDDWYRSHHKNCQHGIDLNGKWSATGTPVQDLLAEMLKDDYFNLPAPKSTGREYFHADWLQQYLLGKSISSQDIQATLVLLTCHTIADAINNLTNKSSVILCGGGANNPILVQQLTQLMPTHHISNAASHGVENDSLEALIFAWLAFAHENSIHGNLPEVTGALRSTILGISYLP